MLSVRYLVWFFKNTHNKYWVHLSGCQRQIHISFDCDSSSMQGYKKPGEKLYKAAKIWTTISSLEALPMFYTGSIEFIHYTFFFSDPPPKCLTLSCFIMGLPQWGCLTMWLWKRYSKVKWSLFCAFLSSPYCKLLIGHIRSWLSLQGLCFPCPHALHSLVPELYTLCCKTRTC